MTENLAPDAAAMVTLLTEVDYRFQEWFKQIPQDSSWWTAEDRRCEKTWNKVKDMLSTLPPPPERP